VIYVYAISERRPGLPPPDAPLRTVIHGGLAGIFGEPPQPLDPPTEQALWQHERVIEGLMADRAVLPLRFASVLRNEGELRRLLDAREAEFEAALDRVRGRVELGVRASVGGPGATPAAVVGGAAAAGPGSAYIAEKLARSRAAREPADLVHAELAGFAAAATSRAVPEPEPHFAGAYLIDRERLPRFRAHVDQLRTKHPELALTCSGPWPPYSFTGATE
jgi:hypothetical protein